MIFIYLRCFILIQILLKERVLSKLRCGQTLTVRVTGRLVSDSHGSTYATLITDAGAVEGTVYMY